ncbi:putative holin-like toxin [Leuconostoc gelidum subsp. gasicomitatum]|uniref:Holin-like toxin n=1 Tax=Leuconostoc gasicomitatum TaxID=115778 RepID=A0A9Q3SWC0_9LACO|nr:putative holin-like toxin [Leuconostoc gasicomitatum]
MDAFGGFILGILTFVVLLIEKVTYLYLTR